jgi:hypothetical protein
MGIGTNFSLLNKFLWSVEYVKLIHEQVVEENVTYIHENFYHCSMKKSINISTFFRIVKATWK